jgi:hypothetical protein
VRCKENRRWENLIVQHHFEGLDADGRIILKRILGKMDETALTGLSWLKGGRSGGLF